MRSTQHPHGQPDDRERAIEFWTAMALAAGVVVVGLTALYAIAKEFVP